MHFLVPRTTSCDKELQIWYQWKKWRQGSGSHSANSAKGLWHLHVGHALRNPTHLLKRSADCEPIPSFAAGLRDCWPWWSGWLWQDIHLPCNTTCNTHATHMQHDMQHDTQHAGKVEKTQGFFFFGHFATRPAFKTFLLLWLLRNRQKRRIPEFFNISCVLRVVLHVVLHVCCMSCCMSCDTRLPRKVTVRCVADMIWNVIYIARSNRPAHPTSPNTAPATENGCHDWSSSHVKRYLQCAEQQAWPSNLTKYCACHEKWLSWLILVTYETSFPLRGQ